MKAIGGPGDSAPTSVQALFCKRDRDVVTLDLIALEAFQWAGATVAQGMPFTVALGVPDDVATDVMSILRPWTEQCDVLALDIRTLGMGEAVLLVGSHDQLFLEFFYPLPEGQ